MASHCSYSAKMALPTVLRNIFRPEVSSHGIRYSPFRRPARHLRAVHHPRSFNSTTPFSNIQLNEHAQYTTTEASNTKFSTSTPSEDGPVSKTKTHSPSKEKSRGGSNYPTKETKDKKTKHKASKSTVKDKKSDPEKKSGKDSYKAKNVLKEKSKPDPWQIQKQALDKKFPGGWNPPKRLSPDALEGIRHLHKTDPARFTTAVLAEEFKTSPEAVRRILKSKWIASGAEMEERRKRWERRHERIWSQKAELGLRPFTKRAKPFSDAQLLYKDE